MAIGAALVDRGRIVQKVGTGVKVEGTTQMSRTHGQWFKCRLFLDIGQYTERSEQGERRKVVQTPQLLFGARDVDNVAYALVAEDEVEVNSPQFGVSTWRVRGDPQPIRKKRTVIGGMVELELVIERPRESVV